MNSLKAIPALGWILIATVFYAGGEFMSKLFGNKPGLWIAGGAVLSYSIGAACWLPALLHRNELARMSMLWGIIATPLTIILGTVGFSAAHQHIGRRIAEIAKRRQLTDGEVALAKRILPRYHKQLPAQIIDVLTGAAQQKTLAEVFKKEEENPWGL